MTLGAFFEPNMIPEECKYIKFESMAYFLYKDKDQEKKCFAISKESKK